MPVNELSTVDIARRGVTPAQRARIERELKPPAVTLVPMPAGWVTTKQALWMLGYRSLRDGGQRLHPRCGLPCRKAPRRPGFTGRRSMLYRREDIERVAHVKREARAGLMVAIRFVVAELEGRL